MKDKLTARKCSAGWAVEDFSGAIWWPNPQAESEIEHSEDPHAVALELCENDPMCGEWVA